MPRFNLFMPKNATGPYVFWGFVRAEDANHARLIGAHVYNTTPRRRKPITPLEVRVEQVVDNPPKQAHSLDYI